MGNYIVRVFKFGFDLIYKMIPDIFFNGDTCSVKFCRGASAEDKSFFVKGKSIFLSVVFVYKFDCIDYSQSLSKGRIIRFPGILYAFDILVYQKSPEFIADFLLRFWRRC